MPPTEDIHPLTVFLREHEKHLDHLRATGRPEWLTVDGQAKVVVQDAHAYQKLLDRLDAVESEHILRQRLASLDHGDPGIEADQVLAAVRQRIERETNQQSR